MLFKEQMCLFFSTSKNVLFNVVQSEERRVEENIYIYIYPNFLILTNPRFILIHILRCIIVSTVTDYSMAGIVDGNLKTVFILFILCICVYVSCLNIRFRSINRSSIQFDIL